MLARNAGKRGYLIKVPAFVIASLTGTSVKYTYTILSRTTHAIRGQRLSHVSLYHNPQGARNFRSRARICSCGLIDAACLHIVTFFLLVHTLIVCSTLRVSRL